MDGDHASVGFGKKRWASIRVEGQSWRSCQDLLKCFAWQAGVQALEFQHLSDVVHLGTDHSAAESFVCPQGLGRMKHLEVRDLRPQKEVAEGRLEMSKVLGD